MIFSYDIPGKLIQALKKFTLFLMWKKKTYNMFDSKSLFSSEFERNCTIFVGPLKYGEL